MNKITNTLRCEIVFKDDTPQSSSLLLENLNFLTSEACESLKKKKDCASNLIVFLDAVLDEKYGTQSQFRITSPFPVPTNDPTQMHVAVHQSIKKLYSPHEKYTKCGIILFDMTPELKLIDCSFEDKQGINAA